ncbi:MAG: response regulator [Flavobacteriales bacterium]|nr:response regulator [Flavobacteriales bacterium]
MHLQSASFQDLLIETMALSGHISLRKEHLWNHPSETVRLKKVYICEDHPLFRESLEQLVNMADDMELVGSNSAAADAISELKERTSDVVLLDLNLSKGDGFEVLEFVQANIPETRVIVLTSYNDRLLADKARRAGASAYMLKDTDGETLLESIRGLKDGKFVSNVVGDEANTDFDPDREFASILKLTRTEKKIVKELIGGASVADIAGHLFISENTVKNHKKNIYRKLQVSTQPELILLCQKHGLLD